LGSGPAGSGAGELNKHLKQYDLFFGPEASTSNRCMIGGMVGNNACGANSLVYGSTRDHTLEVNAITSDGSEIVFKPLSTKSSTINASSRHSKAPWYRNVSDMLSDRQIRPRYAQTIRKSRTGRRNTGTVSICSWRLIRLQATENLLTSANCWPVPKHSHIFYRDKTAFATSSSEREGRRRHTSE